MGDIEKNRFFPQTTFTLLSSIINNFWMEQFDSFATRFFSSLQLMRL